MSLTYVGQVRNISAPTSLTITGITNTNPATVTVSAPLPSTFVTGIRADITNVVGGTAINGIWDVTVPVVGGTTFTVPVSPGGAYVSGGSVQALELGGITIPSDGDADAAASVDVAIEHLEDVASYLTAATGAFKCIGISSLVPNTGGGGFGWVNGATIFNTGGTVLTWGPPATGEYAIIFGLQAGDVIEVEFAVNYTVITSGGALTLMLGAQVLAHNGAPSWTGAGPAVSSCSLGTAASPANTAAQATLIATIPITLGQNDARLAFGISTTGATQVALTNAIMRYRVWRPTNVPQ